MVEIPQEDATTTQDGGNETSATAVADSRSTDIKDAEKNNETDKKVPFWKRGKNKTDKKAPEDGEKNDEPTKGVSFSTMFRYATRKDWILMATGLIGSIGSGACLPLLTIFLADLMTPLIVLIGLMEARDEGQPIPQSQIDLAEGLLVTQSFPAILNLVYVGIAAFVGAFMSQTLWAISGENQAKLIREKFVQAALRQNIAFYDDNKPGEITSRLLSDTYLIQEGLSEKVAKIFRDLSTFITGIIIAFVRGPILTLVLLSAVPALGLVGFLVSKLTADEQTKSTNNYAKAGGVAQEVITNIRTVAAFGGQEREVQRYSKYLDVATKADIKRNAATGAGLGLFFLVIYLVYALGFWYGARLIDDRTMDAGAVLNTFFAVVIGASSLSFITPSITAVASGRGSAAKIYAVIERQPEIDSASKEGKKLQKISGEITFKNIAFTYPSRKDVPVYTDFSLTIPAGKTVAVVGESGSGKSTLVQLLERYYDVDEGQVLLDGVDIKELNLQWYRSQIGLVSQEPLLFNGTVRSNLELGMPKGEKATTELLERVIEAANAQFIKDLPKGFDTRVGEKGTQLSGGQKQRIAVARSMLADPKIMLLDEATSALDTTSERLVQAALDSASEGRTTLVIAHRLSTIKHVDHIVVLSKGRIVEEGKHEELIARDGVYTGMVKAQELKTKKVAERKLSSMRRSVSGGKSHSGDAKVHIEGDVDEDGSMSSDSAPSLPQKRADTVETRISTVDSILGVKGEKVKFTFRDYLRVFAYQKPHWYMLAIGAASALIFGAVNPLFAILFSSFTSIFSGLTSDFVEQADRLALYFTLIAIGAMIFGGLQIALVGVSGDLLTRVLREEAFRTILRQETGWFDDEKHSSGLLCGQLADDMTKINGAVGGSLGTQIQVVSSIVIGIVLAFVYGWQLTLVLLATAPLLIGAGVIEAKVMFVGNNKAKTAYTDAGQVACDAIQNIRTVQALAREETFFDDYVEKIGVVKRTQLRSHLIGGVAFGFSQAMLFLVYGFAFYIGIVFVLNDIMIADDVLMVIFLIVFSLISAGQVSQFAQNAAKGQVAAKSFFELLDRVPEIRSPTKDAKSMVDMEGRAEGKEVFFRYPTRPNVRVLRGVDFQSRPGKMVALVGSSGCGKSTIVSLIERLYDALEGEVDVEGVDVRDWNLASLRENLSIVSQEPNLLSITIGQNISYSKPGATQDEIEEASKAANIHDFIMDLPDKYDTEITNAQLSGGQKQRVAIARALLRNPKILLLDEATSALDSASEGVVQAALDQAAQGRTTVTIAHRLSTIQNADEILVIDKGQVVEVGKHFDLIEKKGIYATLVKQQRLGGI